MKIINLLQYHEYDLSFYLGIEKYLINKNDDNDYFFIWDINKSIIIGVNQLLYNEVNVKMAKTLGYKIYRRPSGGGAICADENCFMFTFISKRLSKDEMYQKYLTKIVDCLKSLGLNPYLSGRNDLMFMNKKFSGNSLYYQNNKTILHGTFLYDSNLDDLVRILTPNKTKLESKGIKSVKERVINLKEYIKEINSKEELIEYINHHIDNDYDEVILNNSELEEINKYKQEFEDKDFIYQENPPFTYKNNLRSTFGGIECYINVIKGIIKKIVFTGDFFINKDLDELYKLFIGKKFSDIKEIIKDIDISEYIENMNNEELIKLLVEED